MILVFLLIGILPNSVRGDGCWVYRPSSLEQWVTMPQEKQIGIINFRNGYEKLILVVDIKNSTLQGDTAAWIFPVPSTPDKVQIDILNDVPNLYGTDLRHYAQQELSTPYFLMYLSQPFLLPLWIVYTYTSSMMYSAQGNAYTVYEHIEKNGLTTEKIDANDSLAFQSYLITHNLSLPDSARTIIDEYIGEDYCFIVSWISNITAFKHNATQSARSYYYYGNPRDPVYSLGVSINFPSESIYYPLKLTSSYGNQTIPIYLQIIDYVTPHSYPLLAQEGLMRTWYFEDLWYTVPANLTTFFAEQLEREQSSSSSETSLLRNLHYTQLEIEAKAKYFTEDLWIEDTVPQTVSTLDFIASNSILVLLFLFIALSCLASLIAGMLIYSRQHPSFYKFALLGLSNLGGLLGFALASFLLKIEQRFVKNPSPPAVKRKAPLKWLSIGVLLTFLLIFLFIFGLFSPGYSMYSMWSILYILLMITFFIGPIVATVALLIVGYYKDKQKIGFILAFSLLFIGFVVLSQFLISSLL